MAAEIWEARTTAEGLCLARNEGRVLIPTLLGLGTIFVFGSSKIFETSWRTRRKEKGRNKLRDGLTDSQHVETMFCLLGSRKKETTSLWPE